MREKRPITLTNVDIIIEHKTMLWPLGSPKRAMKQEKFVSQGPPFLMVLASTPPSTPPTQRLPLSLYWKNSGILVLDHPRQHLMPCPVSLSSACQPELSDYFFLYSVLA